MDFMTEATASAMCAKLRELSLVIRERTMNKRKFYVALSLPVGVSYA